MAHRLSDGGANSAAKTLALLGLVLLAALGIRLYVASRAAMISRDGTTFIWYAQALARDPLAEMRSQRQHPLYPTMVLGAHRVVTTVGKALPNQLELNDPVLSWEKAGMSVTLLGGLAAVLGVYALTRALFERNVEKSKHRKGETTAVVSSQLSAISQRGRSGQLNSSPPPLKRWANRVGDTRVVALIAALLAALAAEFCQLSADVLTDMPHLALYLFALALGITGLRRRSYARLIGSGALSGIAFLIRPEGAEPAVVVAAVALVGTRWPVAARLKACVAVAVAGLAFAGPYMLVTGKLVQKKAIGQLVSNLEPTESRKVETGEGSGVRGQGLGARGEGRGTAGEGLVARGVLSEPEAHLSGVALAKSEASEPLSEPACQDIACRRHVVTIAQHFSAGLTSSPDQTFLRPVGTYVVQDAKGVSAQSPGLPAHAGYPGLVIAAASNPNGVVSVAFRSQPLQGCLASPDVSTQGRPLRGQPWALGHSPLGAAFLGSTAGAGVAAPLRAVGIVAEDWVRCLRVTLLVPAIVWLVLRRVRTRRGAAGSSVPELAADGLRLLAGGTPPALPVSGGLARTSPALPSAPVSNSDDQGMDGRLSACGGLARISPALPDSPFAPVQIGLRVLGAAMTLHVAIAMLLIIRFDYWELFSMRHVVVLAAMTLPISAAGVLAIIELVGRRRGLVLAALIAVLVLPTGKWMLEARYADEAYLRRAGEWIRSQSPASAQARVLTTRNQVAFYAGGTLVWGPLDADFAQYLAEAREKRPEWLVFDERRLLKMSPTFFADLTRSARPGELVEAKRIEQRSRRGVECAVVYRYNP